MKNDNEMNKSLFLEQLGDTPQLRVLDFLIDNHFFDFPITAIAKGSFVSYNSLRKFFPSMINSGVVAITRRIGKSDYYRLNINHLFVKNLMRLDWSLALSGGKNNSTDEIPVLA